MPATQFIEADRVRCRADASSRKDALEQLSRLLAELREVPPAGEIYSSLNKRERLGSTCLGNGVALPHCRLPDIELPVAAMLLLNEPVDFDGEDSEVSVVLGVLLPENEEHRELAALATALREEQNLSRLLSAADSHSAAEIVNQQFTSSNNREGEQ